MKLSPEQIIDLFKQYGNWDKSLGLEIALEKKTNGEEDLFYQLEIDERHLSRPTTSHGGVIAAMMDSVLGIRALQEATSRGHLCSTVEFKINFLRPALKGDKLEGKAKIDFSGKSLIVLSAQIYATATNENKPSSLVAVGQGTFNLYLADSKEFNDFNS